MTVALVVLVTFEAWLGDRLTKPAQASRAAFAAHVLVVPVLFAGFVGLWQRRRRPAMPDAPAEITEAEAEESKAGPSDDANEPTDTEEAREPRDQEQEEKPEAER